MMRAALLWASENRTLRETFPKYAFAKAAVKKFMPGEKIDDAIREAKRLNDLGAGIVFTRLGERHARHVQHGGCDLLERRAVERRFGDVADLHVRASARIAA